MKRLVGLAAAAALVVGGVAACGETGADEYTEICVNAQGVRVPEYQCDATTAGQWGYYYAWYPYYVALPPYGGYPPAGGARTLPATARKSTTRVPSAGQAAKPRTTTRTSTETGTSSRQKQSVPTTRTGSGGSVKTQPVSPPRVSPPRVSPPRVGR